MNIADTLSDCMSGRVVPWQRRCCWLYFARWRADASATRNGLSKRRMSRKQTPKRVLFTASRPALRNFFNVAWLGISIAKLPLWRLRATIPVDRNRSRSTIELVKPRHYRVGQLPPLLFPLELARASRAVVDGLKTRE